MKFWVASYKLLLLAAVTAGLGQFENHGDIGSVLHPGSVAFDAAKGSYTITASGENLGNLGCISVRMAEIFRRCISDSRYLVPDKKREST